MRFKFAGDHANYHCGSDAVSEVIRNRLLRIGEIVKGEADYDALVVNGEGSMHHSSSAFHVKMRLLAEAQVDGKKTFLINSLWENNPNTYDPVLMNLDGFTVRGYSSKSDLAKNHGIDVHTTLDLSYFAPVDETAPYTDLGGSVVITDIFSEDLGFVWLSGPKSDDWGHIDMREMTWSSLVKTLRTARLLISGRHHGMYASCRARTPFIPVRGNSHKFSDLLESARTPIPICMKLPEIPRLISWTENNRSLFDQLFNWMDEQQGWPDLLSSTPPPRTTNITIPPAFDERTNAIMAVERGDYELAGVYWQSHAHQLVNPSQQMAEALARAGDYFMRAGKVEIGATLLFNSRIMKPKYQNAVNLVRSRFILPSLWERPESSSLMQPKGDGWGRSVFAAVESASRKPENAFFDLAHSAVTHAESEGGLSSAAAARLLIAARLIVLSHYNLAKQWWERSKSDQLLDALEEEDSMFIASSCCQKRPHEETS